MNSQENMMQSRDESLLDKLSTPSISNGMQEQVQQFENNLSLATLGQGHQTFQAFIKDPPFQEKQEIKQPNQETQKPQKKENTSINSFNIFSSPEAWMLSQDEEESILNLHTPSFASQSTQSQEPSQRRKQPYPTKNYLPVFKPYFLKYLKTNLNSKQYWNHPLIVRLLSKHGINLQDFENLFNEEMFRKIWISFFKKRFHYRQLMTASLSAEKKKVYFSKIYIFEEAFRKGKFPKINY